MQQSERSNSFIFNKIKHWRLWKLLGTTCIFLSPLSIPLVAIALILLYVYRRLVEIVLRIQLGNKFAGLLKSADCLWTVEDNSLSIINILMISEKTAQDSDAIYLKVFMDMINDRIVSKAAGTTFEKLLYLRNQKFGYYFWERSEEIDLKDRIRWLECVDANCDGSCEDGSGEYFRKILENVCNKPMPDDHKATWEILIGKRCPKSKSHVEKDHLSTERCFNTDIRKIPILFRIHHILGDGLALLDLLHRTILKENEIKEMGVKIKNITSSEPEIVPALRNVERNFQNGTDVRVWENILLASMSFTYIIYSVVQHLWDHFWALLKLMVESLQQAKISLDYNILLSFRNIVLKIYGRFKEVTNLTITLLSLPKFLIQQAIRTTDEENALHGPPTTGKKIMSYWLENDMTNDKSQNLLTKIREIRKNTGCRFDDIVLAAFSASVHKYHLRINKPAPDALTMSFPVKMPTSNKTLTLDNHFSIGFLPICVANANGQIIVEPNRDSQFFKRLQDIKRANKEYRKRSDIFLNLLVIKYISALLPVKMLKIFSATCFTLAFSNIYGPKKVRIMNNYLSNMVFWLPNRNKAALSFSVLSYANKLHLGLIADESIVKDEKYFMKLLENTVHEIDTAYNMMNNMY